MIAVHQCESFTQWYSRRTIWEKATRTTRMKAMAGRKPSKATSIHLRAWKKIISGPAGSSPWAIMVTLAKLNVQIAVKLTRDRLSQMLAFLSRNGLIKRWCAKIRTHAIPKQTNLFKGSMIKVLIISRRNLRPTRTLSQYKVPWSPSEAERNGS